MNNGVVNYDINFIGLERNDIIGLKWAYWTKNVQNWTKNGQIWTKNGQIWT